MPFPFLYLAVSLASGIVLASIVPWPPAVGLAGFITLLLAAWILFALKKLRPSLVLLLAATVFFGAAWSARWNRKYESNALHTLATDAYADFFGTIARSPSPEMDREILVIRVDRVAVEGRMIEARGNLRLAVPRSQETPPLPELFTGDKVKVSARLSSSKDFNNFNAPFYGRYLKSRDIHARAYSKSALLIEKTARGRKGDPLRSVSILRRALRTRLERSFPGPPPAGISPEGAVLEGLLLGDDGRMDEDTVGTLQKTGLYHLFAISGAHIAIVTFLFFSLFKLVRVPRRVSYAILIICLVFYALLVEGSPSVLRAVIMAVAYLAGKLLWKDAHLLNTISISAFALLVMNPSSLFDPGFQLTFAATLSIILFYPKIFRIFPRLPLQIAELTAMSVTASLGVLPILVSVFNRVTFSSLILNTAAVPLIGVVMGAGYAFFPVAFAAPFLAAPFAFGLGALIRIFSWLSHRLDSVHFLSYRVPTPPGLVVAGYFAFLLLLLAPAKFRRQKAAVFAGFAVFFLALILYPFPSRSSDLKVTFLDVGQGDSILIEFPGSKKMLVDGGGFPASAFDVGERVVSPFLWRKGIKKIDVLVMTHSHPDHAGGLAAVARNFRIGEFWEADASAANPQAGAVLSALAPSVPVKRISRGFVRKEAGAEIEVLHPPDGPNSPPEGVDNDRSAVLRLTFGRISILLPADISRDAEAGILATGALLRSRIMKSPHHGSATSSSEPFLDKVRPEYAVISVGQGNSYGFPQADVLERYTRIGARVFRTDLDGAVEFSTDGAILHVRTATVRRDAEPRIDSPRPKADNIK
jgi:competence protein ComEC